MVSSIDDVLKERETREMIRQMDQAIKDSEGNEGAMYQNLSEVLWKGFSQMESLRKALARDLQDNDTVLMNLSGVMQSLFFGDQTKYLLATNLPEREMPREADKVFKAMRESDKVKRQYLIRAICPRCTVKKELAGESFGRKQTKVIQKATKDYISDTELLTGNADSHLVIRKGNTLYPGRCKNPDCNKKLLIINSANMVMPKDNGFVERLSFRVKSSGRWLEKVVDLLMEPEAANVHDLCGFYVLIDPSRYLKKRRGEKALKKHMMNKYGYQLCRGRMSLEDRTHYAVLDYLQKKLPWRVEFNPEEDDYVRNPKVRMAEIREGPNRDGDIGETREEYKGLHFYVHVPHVKNGKVQTLPVEGQIKTVQTFHRENDPKSPINHEYYEEKARGERAKRWDGRHMMIYDLLRLASGGIK